MFESVFIREKFARVLCVESFQVQIGALHLGGASAAFTDGDGAGRWLASMGPISV